jgi:hypothetical protein
MNIYSDFLIDFFNGNKEEAMNAFSKLLPGRLKIVEILKKYKKDYGKLHLKENYNVKVPINEEILNDKNDYLIVNADGLIDIKNKIDDIEFKDDVKYELSFIKLTDLFKMDELVEFFENLNFDYIDRIKIENFDELYKKLLNLERDEKYKIIDIFKNIGIDANVDNYQYVWFKYILDKFVGKLMFGIELNDYIFYNNNPDYELMFDDIKILLNNSFLDEIIIKLNYFTWEDRFDKIIEKLHKINYGELITLKFDGLMPLYNHYKYPNSDELVSFDDFNFFMSEVLPELYIKIKNNFENFNGFEISGGFLGYDVYDHIILNDLDSFNVLKEIICENRDLIKDYYNKIKLTYNDTNFICVVKF